MAIISENEKSTIRYSSSHLHYALTYILITLVFLIFLNIYSSSANQSLICQNKEKAMLEKCQLAASEIENLEVLNTSTVTATISQMSSLRVTRLIVVDQSAVSVYDTNGRIGAYILLPEIVSAMQKNDVFSWQYFSEGFMYSHAAVPIMSYDTVIGCVYMMECDTELGELIASLQKTTLSITIVLIAAVIIFSIVFSILYSSRLRLILSSMRIIRGGDYTHKVEMRGQDELRFLGDEFNELTERLQTSENKRRQFVSDASHELKTPLASIKLLSDSILQNDMDPVTIREFVEDIGNEADRLNRMTQKLLSLTKMEGQQDSTCEIVKLAPTIQRVLRMLSEISKNNEITIVENILEDCPILIIEDDLYQIIFNLVENGIKYNRPGGKLTISVQREDDNAIVKISDTGVGIPEDSIDHLFERFYRVDKARSRKTGGSGLGLSIVRSLIERNNGTITVNSVYGQGSTFIVTFPIFDIDEEDTEEC